MTTLPMAHMYDYVITQWEYHARLFDYHESQYDLNLYGDTLRNPDGSTIRTKDVFEGIEVLGIYFSANWSK